MSAKLVVDLWYETILLYKKCEKNHFFILVCLRNVKARKNCENLSSKRSGSK